MHKLKITKRYLLIILISCLLLLISGSIMLSYSTYDSSAGALEIYGEVKSGKGSLTLTVKCGDVNWNSTATNGNPIEAKDLDPYSGILPGSDTLTVSISTSPATGYHRDRVEIPEDNYSVDGLVSRPSWKITIGRWDNFNTVKHVNAYFSPNTYSVSYNLNGGSKSSTYNYYPTSATYDSAFNVGNPTKTGYSFKGWTGSGINTSTAKYGSTKMSQQIHGQILTL